MKRIIDLTLSACRARQSPRTGFVHYFPVDAAAKDTIPLFENFCFALALFRQKTAEAALEGKELLERLLAFQSVEGNFPIYLHDYPRCWDRYMALKIAPVLFHVLRFLKMQKVEEALQKILAYSEKLPPLSPLWEMRRCATLGKNEVLFEPKTAQEWFEWLVSRQLRKDNLTIEIPYSKELQAFLGEHEIQEGGEPQPVPIEWLLAEKEGFGKRLLVDHPHQMHTALLFPVEVIEKPALLPNRFLWKGEKLHSLFVPKGKFEKDRFLFKLTKPPEEEFEVALYCDLGTNVVLNGKKGLVFRLEESVQIETPGKSLELTFSLLEGEGDFLGHLSRANRPGQLKGKDHEAYDWQIGLRTLRRSERCVLGLRLDQIK